MRSLFKKLIPSSLLARLILIFLSGLLLVVGFSILLNQGERDRLLTRVAGKETARRIAETVFLLDPLTHEERQRIVAVLNVPPQRVALYEQPPAFTSTAHEEGPKTQALLNDLETLLGTDFQVKVHLNTMERRHELYQEYQRQQTQEMGRHHMMRRGHRMGMGGNMGRGRMWRNNDAEATNDTIPAPPYFNEDMASASYFIKVELTDGQWVTFDTYPLDGELSRPWRLFITLGISILIILALLYIAVRWVTQPLKILSDAADALGQDLNKPPIPEKGSDEIKRATSAFNTMQKRLKSLIDDRSHLFAAMSHDLKTPITRLRLRAEMLEDEEQRNSFEKDLKEMEAMVNETLSFMRGIEASEQKHPVNINAMLESLRDDYLEMGKNITLTGQAQKPLTGVAPLLKRCLTNLVDNAIFYGQAAHIAIEDSPEQLHITITDEGTGIPPEQLEKVFDPFYRVEKSRNRQTGGTGLGLSIAKNIAQAHHGQLKLQNQPKGGLAAHLYFPRKIDIGTTM